MPKPTNKGIFLTLVAIFLVVTVAVIPDIISEEMRAWCLSTFGEGYQGYLLGFFVVGSVILLFLTTDLGQWLRPGAGNRSADLVPGTPDPELVAKVRKYLQERYEHRLRQKLAGRQPVNLRMLPSITGTSKEGAENYITLQEEEVRAAIGDIFTRANNRLLLVGLPGAGKTTLILQLALHLLKRPGNSMPVVLNLATWRSEFETFDKWLKKILPTELGATLALAEQIQKNTPLVLLLDGLDELPEVDRDSCLTAIGEYGADADCQFLISSRIAEYAVTKDAPVNAQVEVAPLTIEQVEMGLAATANIQPESKRLLNALKTDPVMRLAIENPFYLNLAQLLFAPGKNWWEFGFTAMDVLGRQRELVERFVEGAMGWKVKEGYPANKAKHWLSFLASRMTERNMVVFELKDLQYGWWKWSRWQKVLSRLVFGLVFGLVFVLIGGLIGGLLGGFSGLIFGLLGGLSLGLMMDMQPQIVTKDYINWSWGNFLNSLLIGLITGLISGLFDGLITGLVDGLHAGLIAGLHTGLYIGLIFGLTCGLLIGLGNQIQTDIIQITTPYYRFTASMKLLWFSILQHLLLRYQLYRQGLLPLRLVTFLNALSACHILETDGATWRFRHRILQEWFAEKWVEPEENTKPSK